MNYNLLLLSAKTETKVAFNARLRNQGTEDEADHQIIVNHVVDLNQGNGYDTVTGVFVAPVSGIYEFHMKITHVPPGAVHVHVSTLPR